MMMMMVKVRRSAWNVWAARPREKPQRPTNSLSPSLRAKRLRLAEARRAKAEAIQGRKKGLDSAETSSQANFAMTALPRRKNPPRISAGGFRAKQLTLPSAHHPTGPVKLGQN
jgi:hypothetical protein